jgi:integrase/recombinase XerC/integrase/recombinase XerD
LRNDAIIALLYDAGLRVGELVQVDVEMLREGRSELYLPGHIQKDYPNDNSPTAVAMELGSDTSRTLNSYLASRWKIQALFLSRKADRITEQEVRYMLPTVAEAAGDFFKLSIFFTP